MPKYEAPSADKLPDLNRVLRFRCLLRALLCFWPSYAWPKLTIKTGPDLAFPIYHYGDSQFQS